MHSFRRALLRQTTRTLVRTVPSKHVAKGVATFLNAASPSTTVASRAIVSSMLRSYSSVASIDVPVPSMGDSISEGTVVEWLKQPGDVVATDDVIVVLETDKVSVDVRAPCSGRLLKQLASIDDNVLVGAPLFQLEQGAEGSDVPSTPPSSPAAASPSSSSSSSSSSSNATPEIVNVPSMGDSISEGTIVSWLKSVGDSIAADDVVLIIETDKVSVDVRAPKAGTIQEILASVDDVVAIGAPLFKFVPGEHIPTPSSSTPSIPAAAPTPSQAKTPSTPPPPPPAPSSTPSSSTQPLFFSPERTITREKMSRMRLRTAERLKESQNTSASLTTFQEVDMTNLLNLRKTYKEAFEEKHGVKLGFMSAFVKASSAALLEVPGINAMIDNEHQEIVYRDYVDMSVAVSTPKGLVTPVLQNTESMSFAEVEKKLVELAEKARNGKLTLEEMTGGNFTISNGGVFGSLMGTPIINLPQSGILGMHATKMRPMVVDGVVVPRPMMYLALTYDHRIVDGREATTCLKSIADKIAHPERLLLDL